MKSEFLNRDTSSKCRNHGFSMIEVMVALGLASILLVAVTSMNSFTQNNMHSIETVLFRDELVKSIQQLSSSPSALNKALPHPSNTHFKACVLPPGVGGANPNCTQDTEYPLVLVDMFGAPVTGAAAPPINTPSAGDAPMFYSVLDGSLCKDASGNPITSPTNRCAIEAVTSFSAKCADSGNCQDTNKIAVSIYYRVRLSTSLGIVPLYGSQLRMIIAPPAPMSYTNALSIKNGFFTN